MRAAICEAAGAPLTIDDVDIAGPEPGQVAVRIRACAICHSDVAIARGAWGDFPPSVFGHEASGVVEAIGPGVDTLAPGDHAVVTLIKHCGVCPSCRSGAPVRCTTPGAGFQASPLRRARTGEPIGQGMDTAAFAETVVVDALQVVRAPKDVPFEILSLTACGVLTGAGAVRNTAPPGRGSDVVVIGVGGVGLNTVQAARLEDPRSLIAVDLSEEKLAAAREFGATHTANPRNDDVVARVAQATAGRMAGAVYVTVGARAAMESAPALAARGGAIVLVGMPPNGETVSFDASDLAYRELRVFGSRMGSAKLPGDVDAIIDDYRSGRLRLDALVSRRFAFDDIQDAMTATARGEGLRNVVMF